MNDSTPDTETIGAERLLRLQRAAFLQDMFPSAGARRDRLTRLLRLVEDNGEALVKAISEDFGHRAAQETRLLDLITTISEIKHARRHLKAWMRERRLPTAPHFLPASNRLIRQPLGVVGVVAPWNYPLYLSFGPAAAALAAGNRVLIKPSELTPRFSDLLRRLVALAFPEDLLAVVTGDAEVGKAFVSLPFDHLLFTGSTQVGRLVAQSAARNLTPVTLELGGKSPVIVDRSADLGRAAGAIAFAKLLNAGQTCVAPDYVLIPSALQERFVEKVVAAARAMYPALADNPDCTAIVSERHYQRLQALLEDARAKGARLVTADTAGGNEAAAQRKMPLTIALGVTDSMRIMQEEIFGPILPVRLCDSADDAIRYVNERDRPLALYWFGNDRAREREVLHRTIAGGVSVNDCAWHVAQSDAPFGGVGPSGMGAYHGEWGFRTFTKEKPVFRQSALSSLPLLRPPYGRLHELLVAIVRKVI